MSTITSFEELARYDLGRMTPGRLARCFFTYPAIVVYMVLAAASGAVSVMLAESMWLELVVVMLAWLVYSLVWYVVHRFVLHSRFLYKSRFTASIWKRIHFDHHQNPRDLRVLFGALYTTIPTMMAIAVPVGWAVDATPGALAAFCAALVITCSYEFCHCVQHLNFVPTISYLRRLKQLHLAHHFHNESGNFGIMDFTWDRLFSTYYERKEAVARSLSVFNLGYDENEARRYPWVAALSRPGSGGRDRGPLAR